MVSLSCSSRPFWVLISVRPDLIYAEIERAAYIGGDTDLAWIAGDADDFNQAVDLFEETLENAKVAAFEGGKNEGLEADVQAEIKWLKEELEKSKTEYGQTRKDLEVVLTWLTGDTCNTVKGRRAAAKELQRRLWALPRLG